MQESNLLMYTTEDGLTKIEATFVNDTVWLSIEQMAELFQRDRSVIGKHIRNIFKEGELKKESVWAKFAHTADDGKNYLNKDELDALNKIVTAYLDIAEVHALNHEPMYMKDWLETIDDYLKMTRRDILKTKGTVTHKQAIEKAHEIEQLDEEAERTGVVAELPGTSLLQVLEPRFNGDESFVNIDRIESVQIDTNLWLLRGDVSLNRLEDYIAEAHTQRFYNEKSHPIEGVIRERDTLFCRLFSWT